MAALLLPLATIALLAQDSPAPAVDRASHLLAQVEEQVVELTLANGWTFLLVPSPGAPVVAIETAIDVGSVDDPPGARGLANLFAHLTLQGSERVGSRDWSEERVALAAVEEAHRRWLETLEAKDTDETAKAYGAFLEARDRARELVSEESLRRFLEDAGGAPSLEVEAAPDWTRYAICLPSNQLELWCWLEAERFTRPCLRGFYGERDRRVEARRQALESAPLATLLDQLKLAALTTHPYRHPVEGYVDDLTRLEKPVAEDFFREHYGASRLVTTMVGDVRPDTLRPLLDRYLAAVPANPDSGRSGRSHAEPVPTLGRQIVVSYAAPPRMALAWTAPPFVHTDSPAVEVTARVLGPGPGSRLHRRLVVQDALATDLSVQTGWPGWRSENLVLVTLSPLPGVSPAEIEGAVTDELSKLREDGPAPDELAALLRTMRVERAREVADPARLARLLNRHHLLTGGWRTALARPDQWDEVTPQTVQAVVDVYFTEVRRTMGVLEPNDLAPRATPPSWNPGSAASPDRAEPAESGAASSDAAGAEGGANDEGSLKDEDGR